jgi:hypothetical protein
MFGKSMTKTPLESLRDNLDTLLSAIEDCRVRKQVLPCLVLVYSGIDIAASLERVDGEGIGPAFRRWATRYLVVRGKLDCTADDLWGARCGIVHTYTAASDHSRVGRAREVVYSWGTASAADLAAMVQATGRDYAAIHIDSLVASFRSGVSTFLFEIAVDKTRLSAVSDRAGVWFTNLDKSVGDQFLRVIGRKLAV